MPGALIGKKLRMAVHVLAQKNEIANLEQTIESIYFLLLLDELRVCGVYPPTGDTNLNSNSNPNLYSKNVRLLINFKFTPMTEIRVK